MTRYNSRLGRKLLEKNGMSNEIRELREEKQMTIRQIAKTLNLTESTVRMVMRHLNIV